MQTNSSIPVTITTISTFYALDDEQEKVVRHAAHQFCPTTNRLKNFAIHIFEAIKAVFGKSSYQKAYQLLVKKFSEDIHCKIKLPIDTSGYEGVAKIKFHLPILRKETKEAAKKTLDYLCKQHKLEKFDKNLYIENVRKSNLQHFLGFKNLFSDTTISIDECFKQVYERNNLHNR